MNHIIEFTYNDILRYSIIFRRNTDKRIVSYVLNHLTLSNLPIQNLSHMYINYSNDAYQIQYGRIYTIDTLIRDLEELAKVSPTDKFDIFKRIHIHELTI